MLDDFLYTSRNLAEVLIPILIAIVLIALIVFIFKLVKFISSLENTLTKVDETIVKVNGTITEIDETIIVTRASIAKLDEPLATLANVSNTVDSMNSTANGIVGSVANFAINNSDSLVNWTKDIFGKKDKDVSDEEVQEDFGIYE